jgi:hypothetical protein
MASRDWLSSPLLGAALGAVAGAAAAYFLRAQSPSALSVAEVEAIARRAAASAAPREERKYPAVNTPAKQVCVCMGGQAGCAAAAAAPPPAPAPACDVSRSHALRANAEARADKSPMRRGHFSGAAGCAAELGGGDGVNWRAWRGPARTCSGFSRVCTQSLLRAHSPPATRSVASSSRAARASSAPTSSTRSCGKGTSSTAWTTCSRARCARARCCQPFWVRVVIAGVGGETALRLRCPRPRTRA